mgnify:CR=1 FL=1
MKGMRLEPRGLESREVGLTCIGTGCALGGGKEVTRKVTENYGKNAFRLWSDLRFRRK